MWNKDGFHNTDDTFVCKVTCLSKEVGRRGAPTGGERTEGGVGEVGRC